MSIDLHNKLQKLREEYIKYPKKRNIIKMQAKLIKMAMGAKKDIVEEARDVFKEK